MYKSNDLSLVKIEQLPVSAAQFRSWRNAFSAKTCAIDQTGQDIISTWISEAFKFRRQMAGRSPKGRFMIWLLAQQFRLDLQRGANLTEQSLLKLDCESFTYSGLKSSTRSSLC